MSNYISISKSWGAPKYARDYMSYGVKVKKAGTSDSLLQLLGLLILFVIILVAAYYVSAWVSKIGAGINGNKNITIIETYRLSQNKCIQIVRITDKYFAIAVSKDSVETITQLDEEQIIFEKKTVEIKDFSEVFAKMKNNLQKTKKDENEEK